MASAIVQLKIMPENVEVDLDSLLNAAKKVISNFTEENESQIKTEKEPIAFGLVALKITFVVDENKGLPDSLTESLTSLNGANSTEIIDFRRALG